ncbi:MAG TPA: OsmC family protein [Pseudonocardiaceae bacterium]|nr:OsmC family protein [Pseudonocardiaceae bacterium]
MANRRAVERPTAGTTRTATTVWIGPTAAHAASFWWTSRRSFAVVLWRHAHMQYMSLPGQREELAREEPSEEASPEDLLAGAHSASLAMAIGAALMAAAHLPEHVRVDADCTLDQLPCGHPRVGQMSLTVSVLVPGIEADKFHRIVDAAAMSCPISQALRRNVQIDIDSKLE